VALLKHDLVYFFIGSAVLGLHHAGYLSGVSRLLLLLLLATL